MVQLKIKRLRPDAWLPQYETAGAAGLDVRYAGENVLELTPGQRLIVPTGLAPEVPEGYELQCRPRSGLAANAGISVVNSPGTIDSDYRGEIKVILINHGRATHFINPGDRIAQLVLAHAPRAEIVEVDELSSTERGEGGFGSTGA